MFLNKIRERNPEFIKTAVEFHQNKKILPDTFIVDVDQFLDNAEKILNEANKQNIELYYMLKQIGRNPYLAKELENMGYKGAVVVDFKEAQVMMKNHLHIAHVGHLVQIPDAMIEGLVAYGCDNITVYSYEKIVAINQAAQKLHKVQNICIRVIGQNDLIYSGQTAGFYEEDLEKLVHSMQALKNVKITGVDSFPCFLYEPGRNDIYPQENLKTVIRAAEMLKAYGCDITNVNAPSATCVHTLKIMEKYPMISSAEPGHGLSGTTPYHANNDAEEIPCVLYLTEVSHNFDDHAYIYGGGYYRRGHIENALIGNEFTKLEADKVILPCIDSIDYHFGLQHRHSVGETVLMAFRFQAFVTRSDICLIKGIHHSMPEIIGVYDSLGGEK